MKIKHLKRLVQNLLHTSNENKFSLEELTDFFPELIDLSRKNNDTPQHLIRVLKLPEGECEKPFSLSSTSRSLYSCLEIGSNMPHIIFNKNKDLIQLNTHLFAFEVPINNIYIDFDAVLPLIKEKLSKVSNHLVYNKFQQPVPISKAISLYEKANEKEVIADLTNLNYSSVELKRPFTEVPAAIIFHGFEYKKTNCAYLDEARDYFNKSLPVMDLLYQRDMDKWITTTINNNKTLNVNKIKNS